MTRALLTAWSFICLAACIPFLPLVWLFETLPDTARAREWELR